MTRKTLRTLTKTKPKRMTGYALKLAQTTAALAREVLAAKYGAHK